jgi:ABC-type branched-subunit amino acid transport system substrate-binding protein
MLMGRIWVAGCAAAAVIGLSACGGASSGGSSASSSGPIKVGMIVAKTGPYASSNVPFLDGVQTAVDHANAAGALGGRKLDLVVEDEKSDPKVGLIAYQKLVKREKVVGLVGSLDSSDLQVALLPRLEADKVPSVGSFSTTKKALKPFNKYFFALQPSYADQADVAIASQIQATGKPKARVASIMLPISSGYEWESLVKARVAKAGGTYAGTFPIDPTATDADAQIQKIIKAKPDFIALHGSPTTAVVVLKSMAKFGFKVPVVGIYAVGPRSTYESVPPEYGSLLRYVSAYTPRGVPAAGAGEMEQAAKASRHADEVADANFVNGWVVGQTLVAGLRKAGKEVSRESLVQGLEQLRDFDTGGLSPKVTFGPEKRAGIQVNRPYGFDYTKKSFVADGQYDDYTRDISNEYLPAS